jgi:hypothetical protein
MTISLKQIDEKQSTEHQIIPPDAAEYRAAFAPFPGLRSFAGSVSLLPGRAGEFVVRPIMSAFIVGMIDNDLR